jgi:hypothetical protein
MDNERTQSDLEIEQAIIVEYGQALATAAESCLRYPDRMSDARSEDERAHLRREHAQFLARILDANSIALSVLTEEREPMGTNVIGWLSVIGAGASAAGGVVIAAPLNKTTVIVAVLSAVAAMGTAARALYAPKPNAGT